MNSLVWLFFVLSFALGIFLGIKIGRMLRKRTLKHVASDAFHEAADRYANKESRLAPGDEIKFPNPLSNHHFAGWWRKYTA